MNREEALQRAIELKGHSQEFESVSFIDDDTEFFEYVIKELETDIPTKDLVEELSKREGVKVDIADPYKDVDIKVNGPAIVLTVID